MSLDLRLPSPPPGPVPCRWAAATSPTERGVLAGVFYAAGAGVITVATLDPAAHAAVLVILAGLAVGVAAMALVWRRRFGYAATVCTSVLGPVLIATGVVAGSGGWSSAVAAGLYTFVAVHTALVLHWQHATAVMVWAGGTAVVASELVAAPLPAWAVATVFVLGCGTLSSVTLRLMAEVRRRATTDPLTGAANRSSFEAALQHGAATVARTAEPLALIAIDLDGFRQISNTHGHAAGDRILVDAVAAWQQELRSRDQLARIGGDEFCVVLPGADEDQARAVADRLELVMPAGATCSTGVAMLRDGQSLADLSVAADHDLYASKARRRHAAIG